MEIELIEELHANTRRTRITYRATVNGQPAAIKCYRKPLFGLIHWLRARRTGRKIRDAGAPVPPIVYSGWLPDRRCFCFGTALLEGYRPLRHALKDAPNVERQAEIIRLLGELMAKVHRQGIEQTDGNLTNFLLGKADQIAIVDEDDIRVFSARLSAEKAILNLANVAARLPNEDAVGTLLNAYLGKAFIDKGSTWDVEEFWARVMDLKTSFKSKRAQRNIDMNREFD